MAVNTLCFSPTGGTRRVVDALVGAWSGEGATLDLSDRAVDFAAQAYGEGDVCLIGVPSFGGRVPDAALEHLALVDGGGAAAVLVVAYGNRAYDDTLLELADAAKASGFRVVAAVAAATEHSIMRQFGTGRPDVRDLEELHAFANRIASAVDGAAARTLEEPVLPGSHPFRAYDGVPFKPKAGKACTDCGSCARSCPVGAIPEADPTCTDKDRCISCMRCIVLCPQGARKLNRAVLFVAGKKMAKVCGSRKPNELFLV